jgi:acyl-CoA thioester hydrolase
MTEYLYHLDFQVRDYEIDMQGIVNNAVYQNYLEHTRHEFLKENGIDFAAFTKERINLVVLRVEIDYKFPLGSGDRFRVGLNLVKESRLRFTFLQDIYRLPDQKLILKAKVVGTSLNPQGRPAVSAALEQAIARLLPPGP